MSRRWKIRKRNAAAAELHRLLLDESRKRTDEAFRKLLERVVKEGKP